MMNCHVLTMSYRNEWAMLKQERLAGWKVRGGELCILMLFIKVKVCGGDAAAIITVSAAQISELQRLLVV